MIVRRIGSAVVICLFLWMLTFVCLGYTPGGKPFYGELASIFFLEDAAVPVMNLAIPILLSGTIATILMFQQDASNPNSKSALPSSLPTWMHRLYHRWRTSSGDLNVRRFIIYFICWPLLLMMVGNMVRHLVGEEMSLDDQLMEIGNTFGFMALICLSYFLIPVARQSPILQFFDISPIAAVAVHIWSGRIVIIGVFLHGGFHVYRWKALAGESISAMILPPKQCWSLDYSDDDDFGPECVDEDTDCECYDLLRNLTGVVAMILLAIIGITSLNFVRRNHYRLFFLTHVLAGPATLLITIIHWRKCMAYMAPSILYYIATSFPVMTENRKCLTQDGGIKLTRVERIQSRIQGGRQRDCMSLTVKATPAAVSMYETGQYVKLSVPAISMVSHPFTVNRVPGSSDELRILFRVMGKFTYKLCDLLVNPVGGKLPTVTLDGFHGPQARVSQVLKHDVAVMVAGGIGITPYLSLLEEVHSVLNMSDSSVTKEVVLHWICREQELIEYVRKEYFEPLLSKPNSEGFNLRIIVHRTPSAYNDENPSAFVDDAEAASSSKQAIQVESTGGAFCPSLYSAGSSCSTIHILIATLTFSTISWIGLWVVLALYNYNNAKEEILFRFYAPICIVAIGFLVSWLAKCLFPVEGRRDAMSLRLHDGGVFERVDDGSGDSGGNMEEILGHHDDILQETNSSMSNTTVTYEEREGPRPTVHTLLKQLDSARCPGLMMCGPTSLMDDLRVAAVEKCSIRRCQCIAGEPNIAVYEELFEM
jgi:predicted ferric reductase